MKKQITSKFINFTTLYSVVYLEYCMKTQSKIYVKPTLATLITLRNILDYWMMYIINQQS